MTRTVNVLFLCTGNSARSVMAEALLAVLGGSRFRAYSAGSRPTGQVQPMAVALAAELGYDVDRLRSKSWDEFAGPDAPPLDLVVTVCDSAAGEHCPFWPGAPALAHWGVPDPVAVEGDEAARMQAFRTAFATLRRRVERLVALPVERLDRTELERQARAIAETEQ